MDYQIYTSKHTKAYSKKVHIFNNMNIPGSMPKNKWGTYSLTIDQALSEHYNSVNLIGFDTLSEGANSHKMYDRKFILEYKIIHKLRKLNYIKRLKFVGEPKNFLQDINVSYNGRGVKV